MIQKIFDYWSVWHLLLASYAYLIAHFKLGWTEQVSFLAVLALAILWEAGEWLWNRKAYASDKAMLKNNIIDIGMAVIAAFVTVVLTK